MTEESDMVAAEQRQKERDDMRKMLGIGVTVTTQEVPGLIYDEERGSPSSYEMEGKGPQNPMMAGHPDSYKA